MHSEKVQVLNKSNKLAGVNQNDIHIRFNIVRTGHAYSYELLNICQVLTISI